MEQAKARRLVCIEMSFICDVHMTWVDLATQALDTSNKTWSVCPNKTKMKEYTITCAAAYFAVAAVERYLYFVLTQTECDTHQDIQEQSAKTDKTASPALTHGASNTHKDQLTQRAYQRQLCALCSDINSIIAQRRHHSHKQHQHLLLGSTMPPHGFSSRWPSDRTQKTGLFTDIRCKYLSWFWITIYISTHSRSRNAMCFGVYGSLLSAECHYRIFSTCTERSASAYQTKFCSPLSVAQWVGKLLCCAADLYKFYGAPQRGAGRCDYIIPFTKECWMLRQFGPEKHFSLIKRFDEAEGWGEKERCCRWDAE